MEFSEQELRWLLSSKTCIKVTDTINKKGLEVSYMVSYRVARTGKPHTSVEDIILPAAVDMTGTLLGEKAPKNYTDNVFIKQHCFTTHQWHGRRCFDTNTVSHTSQWILCITAGWVNRRGRPSTAPGICSLRLWGGQLRKTPSSVNHWKPRQQERIFLKYWTALWHQMDFGGQDVLVSVLMDLLVSVLMVQKPWQGDIVE